MGQLNNERALSSLRHSRLETQRHELFRSIDRIQHETCKLTHKTDAAQVSMQRRTLAPPP